MTGLTVRRLEAGRNRQARCQGESSQLAVAGRVKRDLVVKETKTEPIDLVGSMEGSANLALAGGQGALISGGDRGQVTGGVQADEVEGVAQTRRAFAGNVPEATIITTLGGNDIQAGESPDLSVGGKAAMMTEISRVTGGQEGADVGDGGQDGGRGSGDKGSDVGFQLLQLG